MVKFVPRTIEPMHAAIQSRNPSSNVPGVACGDLVRRPWEPSNMVIKATGRRVCNNAGCMADAIVAFEQGDAVWFSCSDCQPAPATIENLTPLRPTNAKHIHPKPNTNDDANQ